MRLRGHTTFDALLVHSSCMTVPLTTMPRISFRCLCILFLILSVIWAPDSYADPGSGTPTKSTYLYFPDQQIYPINLADPNRPQFAVLFMYNTQSPEIADTGDRWYGLKMGGRLGLLQHTINNDSRYGWLLSLDVGFNGTFDIDHSVDNIGWDGIYSFLLSYRQNDAWAFKLGTFHVSSHVGDEYIERTGHTRINYTRQEYQLGVNLTIINNWQWYAELGTAFDKGNNTLQDNRRAQTGLQYLPKQNGWYLGIDIGATEERDWSLDSTLEFGKYISTGTRTWRYGIEIYHGRAQIGEFFLYDEKQISIGLWIDI